MIKTMSLVFLFFLISISEMFSQEVKPLTIFSSSFDWRVYENSNSTLIPANKLSLLYNLNNDHLLTSLNPYSNQLFFTDSKRDANHHPLIFAKINFFGIENLEQHDDVEIPPKADDASFWDNEIIYFVVGAVAATALYIVWQNSGSENPPQKTFGLPPKPKRVYGF
ncbi:MAG: hypothetical protein L3J41_09705 [Melioribacteraceae bacterium]|nr:hypothetical protein [Melioribacteraceae bacterium]